MVTKFTIQCRLPGLNEYIAAMNRNRHLGNKLKQDTQTIIKYSCRGIKESFNNPVWITYKWYEKDRRRDKSNISAFGRKCIEDALQEMSILRNDNWEAVAGFSDEFYIDKSYPRVEVIIDDGLETDGS